MNWFKEIWNWFLDLIGQGGPKFDKFADPNSPFMGYGLVNNWFKQNPKKYMNKLVESEVECMAFEFFEWAKPENFEKVDALLKKFEEYLELAAKKKVLLYVTILNSNKGSGKYGDDRVPSSRYNDQLTKVANKMAGWMNNHSNLFVTPCGEGGAQGNWDRKLQEYCKAIMPRTQMVNNWGSRPNSTDGMAYLAQHPSSTTAKVKPWVVSDHSTIISQLNGGGGLYGTCNYDITMRYAKGLKSTNKQFIYYHFNPNGSIDDEALRALKDAKK